MDDTASEESDMASQPINSTPPRRVANDRLVPHGPTVVFMPFEDAEEERLWDEIMEQRAADRRS
jgi:hypothetical protein